MAERYPGGFHPENMEEEKVMAAAEFLVWMSGASMEKEDAVKMEEMRRNGLGRGREMLTERVQEPVEGKEDAVKMEEMRRNGLGRGREMLTERVQEPAPPATGIDGSVLPRYPPIPFLDGKIDFTACSVPFEKQLTPTDVKEEQNRLSLNKDEVIRSILPLLEHREDPNRGIPVTTYNPEGKEYEMMFKSWSENKFYVLNGGWKSFFLENELMEYRHFVTVWMFRHSQTRKLCFALTWKLTSMYGPCPRPKARRESRVRGLSFIPTLTHLIEGYTGRVEKAGNSKKEKLQ